MLISVFYLSQSLLYTFKVIWLYSKIVGGGDNKKQKKDGKHRSNLFTHQKLNTKREQYS